MESINTICNCLNGLNGTKKKRADTVTGERFEKVLIELQILSNSFWEKNPLLPSRTREKNNRANEILDIFFLQQKFQKKSGRKVQTFEKDSPLDLDKLRRNPSASREVPIFLEKRFELFGPNPISRFI